MEEYQFKDYEEEIKYEDEGAPVENRPRKKFWLVGAGLLLLLLAAAFVAVRLLGFSFAEIDGGMEVVNIGGDGSGTRYTSKGFDIDYDERYPDVDPDVSGIFVRREDNSVFVGTGQITMTAKMEEGGDKIDMNASHDGPVREVVVTGKTQLFIDKSYVNMEISDLEKGEKLQQVLEETDSLDILTENSTVNAWGKSSGDRVIADTLIYSAPLSINIK